MKDSNEDDVLKWKFDKGNALDWAARIGGCLALSHNVEREAQEIIVKSNKKSYDIVDVYKAFIEAAKKYSEPLNPQCLVNTKFTQEELDRILKKIYGKGKINSKIWKSKILTLNCNGICPMCKKKGFHHSYYDKNYELLKCVLCHYKTILKH